MATRSTMVTATTTVTLLPLGGDADNTGFRDFVVKNVGATKVYLGGNNVTTANGFPLDVSESLAFSGVGVGDAPYVVTASGTSDLAVLESGI